MKIFFPFAILIFISGLISCSENEEPVSPLVGKWENRVFIDSLDVWFVETMEFKNDSIFDLNITVRQSETGPDLGYRFMTTAWYSLGENELTYYYSFSSWLNYGEKRLFVDEEDLEAGIVDFFQRPKVEFQFGSNRRSFILPQGCLALFSVCGPNREFIRVN
jgi:hypothetical protein